MPLGRKGEQFHPSRDVSPVGHEPMHGPTEYELPFGGNKGIHIIGGGYFDENEQGVLASATKDWKEAGESNALTQPAQGRLFNPQHVEGANRAKLGRNRLIATDSAAEEIRDKGLRESTIPSSHMQPRATPRGTELPGTEITSQNQGRSWSGGGAAGWYMGPVNLQKHDTIAIDPQSQHPTDTLIHEMGHRRHIGEFRDPSDALMTHPSGMNPDPLKEGAADAYEDRYAGPKAGQVRAMNTSLELGQGKFDSYQFTGYSTNAQLAEQRGWDSSDRAVYAATRAHGSETGEQALYKPAAPHPAEQAGRGIGTMRPTMDATLHHLVTTSPHAAQALRDTGLESAGEAAVRRHMDRTLLHHGQEVQGALFDELRGENSGQVGGYIANPDAVVSHPGTSRDRIEGIKGELGAAVDRLREPVVPHTMQKNQFGEKPRTQFDLLTSLGALAKDTKGRGFL